MAEVLLGAGSNQLSSGSSRGYQQGSGRASDQKLMRVNRLSEQRRASNDDGQE